MSQSVNSYQLLTEYRVDFFNKKLYIIIPLIKGNRWAFLVSSRQELGARFGHSSEHPGVGRDSVTGSFTLLL